MQPPPPAARGGLVVPTKAAQPIFRLLKETDAVEKTHQGLSN